MKVSVRVNEFDKRLSSVSFGDSVKLLGMLKRSKNCEGRLLVVLNVKNDLVEEF
ncbi:hypothetical protein GBA52_026105 [Prunus armeniaca]|nr:hypothetical protein GBA52_026105 [Prunus armeniaca]